MSSESAPPNGQPPLGAGVAEPCPACGGAPAQVLFSGLAPGYAGLYQVNAIVPAGIPAAADVPLLITAAGLQSTPVTIGIAAK